MRCQTSLWSNDKLAPVSTRKRTLTPFMKPQTKWFMRHRWNITWSFKATTCPSADWLIPPRVSHFPGAVELDRNGQCALVDRSSSIFERIHQFHLPSCSWFIRLSSANGRGWVTIIWSFSSLLMYCFIKLAIELITPFTARGSVVISRPVCREGAQCAAAPLHRTWSPLGVNDY